MYISLSCHKPRDILILNLLSTFGLLQHIPAFLLFSFSFIQNQPFNQKEVKGLGGFRIWGGIEHGEIQLAGSSGQQAELRGRRAFCQLSVVRCLLRIKQGAGGTAISEKCGKSEKGNYVSNLGVLSLFSRLSSPSRLATWFTVYHLPFTIYRVPCTRIKKRSRSSARRFWKNQQLILTMSKINNENV